MPSKILLILKPEIFDHSLTEENGESILLPHTTLPDRQHLLEALMRGIVDEYTWPFPITWTEDQIREQYNQPHHFLSEPGYPKNRADTLAEIYDGKYAEIYVVETDDESLPNLLTLRKKEVRKKYLKNPDVAFRSLYHVSDSLVEGEREVVIYRNFFRK